jgi:hypothetical protein
MKKIKPQLLIVFSALFWNLSFAKPKMPFTGLPDNIKVLVSNNGYETPRPLG